MTNKLYPTNSDNLEQIKNTVENQLGLIAEMQNIKEEVQEMESNVTELYTEIKEEFEEFKKSVPLSPGEEEQISELAKEKAVEFTKELFAGKEVSTQLFGMKLTHLTQGVYTSLKRAFEHTGTYRTLLHVKFNDVYDYLSNLRIRQLPTYYLEFTKAQQEAADKNNDSLIGFELR